MADDVCPGCRSSLQGDPIPAEHRTHKLDHDEQVIKYGRCYCLPWGDATHFSRLIGHEVPGVYDGVLFWVCPDCDHAWPRWTDGGRLTEQAAAYVQQYRSARAAS